MNFFEGGGFNSVGRRTAGGDPNSHHNPFPLTSPNHQIDINHLWTQVQELSSILAANRENASNIQKKVDKIKKRVEADEAAPLTSPSSTKPETTSASAETGEVPPPAYTTAEEAEIISETNETLRKENAILNNENEELSLLVSDYETILEKILESLRVYAYEHSISTINIHQSYANQLAQERQTNAVLRQSVADMQSKLIDFSSTLRKAHQAEWLLEPDIIIEELKAENAMLREALALKSPGDPI